MQFYEKYVEDFQKFKELHRFSVESEDKIKIIEETCNNIDEFRNIIEKYKVILEEVKEHLNFNKEEYSKYYSECQKKNNALPNYSIDDLLSDLKKMIPKNEKIQIAGNDKINFTLNYGYFKIMIFKRLYMIAVALEEFYSFSFSVDLRLLVFLIFLLFYNYKCFNNKNTIINYYLINFCFH